MFSLSGSHKKWIIPQNYKWIEQLKHQNPTWHKLLVSTLHSDLRTEGEPHISVALIHDHEPWQFPNSNLPLRAPAEPRPGHPGQLDGLPRYSRGGRGEGGAYAGSPAGARRTEARARGDWREAGGGAAAAAAEPGTAPPSLDAAEGEPLRFLGPRAEDLRWGTESERRCEEDGASAVRGFDGPLKKAHTIFFFFLFYFFF